MVSNFDEKLKECIELCYNSDKSDRIPRYKMDKKDKVAHLLPQLQGSQPIVKEDSMITTLNGYKMISKLGEGGMGAVYKALQLSMERTVAIKLLTRGHKTDDQVQRFVREAKSVAKLNHENIITGIDFGSNDKFHYFVMEYVEGENVAQILLKQQQLSPKKAFEIVKSVVKALQYAHNKHKIVHRDIKPENIMINAEGHVKLCDLGLARSATEAITSEAITVDGGIMGTPLYMSPEQCRADKDIDHRSDIYSLGITLFHMLTGKAPFEAPHPAALCLKHLTTPLPNPKKNVSGLPNEIFALLKKMTAKERNKRFQNYEELFSQMEACEKLLNNGSLPKQAKTTKKRQTKTLQKIAPRNTRTLRTKTASQKAPVPYIYLASAAAILIVFFILWSNHSHTKSIENIKNQIVANIENKRYEQALQKTNQYKDLDADLDDTHSYLSHYAKVKKASKNDNDYATILSDIDQKVKDGPKWYQQGLQKIRQEIVAKKSEKEQQYYIANIEKKIDTAIFKQDLSQFQESLQLLQKRPIPTKWGKTFAEQKSTLWNKMANAILMDYRKSKSKDKIQLALQMNIPKEAKSFLENKLKNTTGAVTKEWHKEDQETQNEEEKEEDGTEQEIDKVKTLFAQEKYFKAAEVFKKAYQEYSENKDKYKENHAIHNKIKLTLKEINKRSLDLANIEEQDNLKELSKEYLDKLNLYKKLLPFLDKKNAIHSQMAKKFYQIHTVLYKDTKRVLTKNSEEIGDKIDSLTIFSEKVSYGFPTKLTVSDVWQKSFGKTMENFLALNDEFEQVFWHFAMIATMVHKIENFIPDYEKEWQRTLGEHKKDLQQRMVACLDRLDFENAGYRLQALKDLSENKEELDQLFLQNIKKVINKACRQKNYEKAEKACEKALELFSESEDALKGIKNLEEKIEKERDAFPGVEKVILGNVDYNLENDNFVKVNYYLPEQNIKKIIGDWQAFSISKRKPLTTKMYSKDYIYSKHPQILLWKYPVRKYFENKFFILNPGHKQSRKKLRIRKKNMPQSFGIVMFYRPNKSYLLFLCNQKNKRNQLFLMEKNKKKLLFTSKDKFVPSDDEHYEIWVKFTLDTVEFTANGEYHNFKFANEDFVREGFFGLWTYKSWMAVQRMEIQTHLNMTEFPIDRKPKIK